MVEKTRNLRPACQLRSHETLDFTRVSKLKFQLFFAFSPAFLSKDFLRKKRVEIYGDVPKWLKGPDSKSGRRVLPVQEFESLHLHHNAQVRTFLVQKCVRPEKRTTAEVIVLCGSSFMCSV